MLRHVLCCNYHRNDDINHADDISVIEEKLHPFKVDQSFSSENGIITLDPDVYRLISVTRANELSDLGFDVEEISKRKLQYIKI